MCDRTGDLGPPSWAPTVPPCVDLLDPFVLGPTGSTTQVRSPGCNNLKVENHGPGSVEVKFSASGRVFIVPPAGTPALSWASDASVTIRALGTPAAGASQQV